MSSLIPDLGKCLKNVVENFSVDICLASDYEQKVPNEGIKDLDI